jgi:hypothetical protein
LTQVASFQKPYAIRDAAGNAIYESAALASNVLDVYNSGAATIGRGEALTFDIASVMARWDYAVTGADTIPATELKGARVDAAADVGFLGVALENIPVAVVGRVAGTGSITAVKCLSTLTSNVVGNAVIGSATAGSVDSIATAPVKGTVLGEQLQQAGTGANQTGSATQLLALIAQR